MAVRLLARAQGAAGWSTSWIGVRWSTKRPPLPTACVNPLKSRLYDIIELKEDQVLFIPLRNRCADGIEALGRPVEKHDSRDVVMVV